MVIPNTLDKKILMLFGYSLRLHQNAEPGHITMKAEIVAVYYGMSVDRSLKIFTLHSDRSSS